MGKTKKQAPIFKSLLVALLAVSHPAALSAPTSTNTSFQATVEDTSASSPTQSPALLALAVQAAAEGDKATLSKLYKLSLLVDQKARGEGIRKALRESLAASHT